MSSPKKPSSEDPLQAVDPSRRAFLRRLVVGGAFVAPLVTTYALATSPQVQDSSPHKVGWPIRRTPTPTPTRKPRS